MLQAIAAQAAATRRRVAVQPAHRRFKGKALDVVYIEGLKFAAYSKS